MCMQVIQEVDRLPGDLEVWANTVQEDIAAPLRRAQEDWGKGGDGCVPEQVG